MNVRIESGSYFTAAQNGDLKTVQQYIDENKKDIDVLNIKNLAGNTALMLAAINNHIPVVMALLAVEGIEVDTRIMFLTLFRNLNPQPEKVARPVNTVTKEAFLNAARNDNLMVVEQYIKENANEPAAVNVVNKEGWSALCQAVQGASIHCVKALVAVPSIDVFIAKPYKDSDGKIYFYRSAFDIDGPQNPHPGYENSGRIQQFLYEAAVKSLLKMKSPELTTQMLTILRSRKQNLFDTILRIFPKKEDTFAVLKEIVEKKPESAISYMFFLNKKTANKGVMSQVITRYIELAKELGEEVLPEFQPKTFNLSGFVGGVIQSFSAKSKPAEDALNTIDSLKDEDEKKEKINNEFFGV